MATIRMESHLTPKEEIQMKYLPIVAVLLLNMPVSAAFAGCGGAGNFPGGDNCGLVGGGYQGAPGPIIGGIPALLGIGGIWLWRKLRKN
jgi:hypothetical protein